MIFNNIYKKAIRLYLGDHVLNEIINKKEKALELSYVVKEFTFLVLDLKQFTGTSKIVEAKEVINLLNKYYNLISGIIIKNKGIIDSFNGDSFIGIFGLNDNEHAINACTTALECIQSISTLNNELQSDEIYKLGIGIATGNGAVGNFGSNFRLKFGAVGDILNYASRLQSTTKVYNVDIIISDKTKYYLNNKFKTRELATIQIKGKDGSYLIHELLY
jgi:adenylate cyclase